MPRSKIMDRGEEVITVFPEVSYRDDRGNLQQFPGTEGVDVRVTVSAMRMSASDVPGQIAISNVSMTARKVPGWEWARVLFRGEEWDIITPPHISTGVSRASRHYEFSLRSRNRLDDASNDASDGVVHG